MNFFYYESKFKIKKIFLFGGVGGGGEGAGGGGARVSDFFHKKSKWDWIFFLGGGRGG